MAAPLTAPKPNGQPGMHLAIAVAMIGCITAVHLVTDMHDVAFHNVYRRIYYLPILLAAFSHGLRGGLGAALLSCVGYFPHAFMLEHADPAPAVDKLLEMVLYVAVGGLTGWFVEQRKASEARLTQSLAERDELSLELVRAGRLSAMGELVSGLAHEIRNPLAAILGGAEAMASEFDESHRKHRIAEITLREIGRLDRLVTDFLAFARPNTSERGPVNLADVAAEMVELAKHGGSRCNAVIEIDEVVIEANGDRAQIGQVVLNLLLNACQAVVDREDPDVRVLLERRTRGAREFACIGIADNGPGVSDELREQIFNPFFTTRESGTGLGLSISSRIMDDHGGFLDLESSGDGTTVWAYFPVEATH